MRSIKLLSMLLLTIAVISSLHAAASAQVTVRVDPDSQEVDPGNTFTVDIVIENVQDLGSYQIGIGFNSAVVHAVSAVDGSFLTGSKFTAPTSMDNAGNPGRITFGVSRLDGGGDSGSGVLATFTFEVVSSGTSPLDVLEADPNVGLILTASDGFTTIVPNAVQDGFLGPSGPTPEPDIALEPNTLNFGYVLIGNTPILGITVNNVGGASLTVTGIVLTGDAQFSRTDGIVVPFTLASGADTTLTVQFAPDAERTFNGTLTINSNDPDEPSVNVPLSGEGEGQTPGGPLTVRVDPDSQEVDPGNTFTVDIVIENVQDLGSYQIGIGFNSAVVHAVSAVDGPFLTGSKFTAPTSMDNSSNPGRITFGVSRLDGGGDSGTGVLATFTFEVVSSGTSVLDILETDPNVGLILTAKDGYTTITPDAVKDGVVNPPPTGPTVHIDPDMSVVGVGSMFAVDIVIENVQDLGSYQIGIGFNSAVVHAVSAVDGSFLTGSKFTAPTSIDNSSNPGRITFGVSRLDGGGDTGSGVLATFTFEVVSSGTSELDILEADPNVGLILTASDGFTTITPDAVKDGVVTVGDPDIEVYPAYPDTLDFGYVTVGHTSTRDITVENVGDANLEVAGITLTDDPVPGTQFSRTDEIATPFTLAPGRDTTLTVQFAPAAVRMFNGTLTVASNDPDEPSVNVLLTGEGVQLAISGRVFYYIGDPPVAVADVLLELTGDVTTTERTDASGAYAFNNLPFGSYVLKPSKQGENKQAVAAWDAALILQQVVGKTVLSDTQGVAADVTGNGAITAFDASQVLRFVVELIGAFPAGDWRFLPDQREYIPLETSLTDQDFLGIVVGDVSRNWRPSGAARPVAEGIPRHIEMVMVSGPDRDAQRYVLRVDDATGVLSTTLEVLYDPETMVLADVTPGVLASGYEAAYRVRDGRIRIAMAGPEAMQGGGELMSLAFRRLEGMEPSTPRITFGRFNEGQIPVHAEVRRSAQTPMCIQMHPTFPNPFNPETTIPYELSVESRVAIGVYNVSGHLIRTLVSRAMPAGRHTVTWDGTDVEGHPVASGVYLVRMETGDVVQTQKAVLLR